MLLEQHRPHHDRLHELGVLNSPLLMLGAQTTTFEGMLSARQVFELYGVSEYITLDPDGGSFDLDLNDDLYQLRNRYETVFNLGTIEHVWDAHTAWANALRAVKIDGHFVTVTPVQGWDGHGIHITDLNAIRAFVESNGFEIVDAWAVVEPRGVNYWLAAKKLRHVDEISAYKRPQQRYAGGKKQAAA